MGALKKRTSQKFLTIYEFLTGLRFEQKEKLEELPEDLSDQLNESKEFLFTPNQAWKSKLYQEVRQAARELGIKVSGLHRLRSNYAQDKYLELRQKGKTDRRRAWKSRTAWGITASMWLADIFRCHKYSESNLDWASSGLGLILLISITSIQSTFFSFGSQSFD